MKISAEYLKGRLDSTITEQDYYKDVPEKYKKSLTDSVDNFIKVFNDYTNDTNNKLVKDSLKERKINL